MKKFVLYIAFTMVFLAPRIIMAQKEFKSSLLNFNSGLPSDFVNTITKKDNKLYVATQRGLSFYDGYRFQNHKTIKTNIYNLHVANNTIYYYDSQKGLCFVNKFHENAKIIAPNNYNDSSPNNDHYDNIFVDSKNRIWCSNVNYIKYFEPKSNKKHTFIFDKTNTENRKPITTLEFKNNEIWFATYKGLYVLKEDKNSILPHFNLVLGNLKISAAFLLNNNELYLATFDGQFLKYNIGQNTITPILRFSKNEIINQIQFDYNNLIINLNSKVYNFELLNNELKLIYDAQNLKINNVLVDNEIKNYWIATNRGLVQINNNSNIENIKIPSKNPKTVVSIVQNNDETLFLALDNNEIWSYTKNQIWTKYNIPNGICRNLSIYENKIFVASTNGIFVIENNTIQELKLINYTKKIKKCIVDFNENLWVLPENGIVAAFDLKTLQQKQNFIKNPNSFWEGNAWNDILCDNLGTIWVAGWMPKSNGIIKFDFKTNQFLDIEKFKSNQIKNAFSGDFFNRISIDNQDNLLFSSFGGWNIVDKLGNVLFGYNTYQQDIPSDHISGICDDLVGNIWFSTSEGLNVYNKITSKTIRISQIDGLQTDDLIHGFCKLKNGNIAIGNENGFSVINTKQILKNNTKSDLQLIAVKIDGEISNQTSENIILKNTNSELTLQFSDLSFSNKLKVVYRYQFEGEKKWNYLGNTSELTLVKLASGNYNLIVQAGDNFNKWQPKLLKINIEIEPKYYQTWWFLLLCILFISLLVFATNRYLLNQQKIKNILTQNIKNAEMKTLRSQMNPHFMFNTLNSINSYIIENKSNEASKYLTMFSKLMRNILENSKYSEITLEKELQTLKLYIQLEAVRLDNKFDYSITVAQNVDVETLKIPPLILQPFVENAIWHGLHNKKEHGNLKITISLETETLLNIHIIDDGVGRKATSLIKKQQTNHKSYGIEITVSRLKMLNEANSVEIIDLHNNREIPNGTQINLKINF